MSTLIRNGPWRSYRSLKQTIKLTQFQLASFSSVLFAVVSILLGLLSLEVSSVCSVSCPAFFDEGATLPFWRISVASCSSTSDGVKGSKWILPCSLMSELTDSGSSLFLRNCSKLTSSPNVSFKSLTFFVDSAVSSKVRTFVCSFRTTPSELWHIFISLSSGIRFCLSATNCLLAESQDALFSCREFFELLPGNSKLGTFSVFDSDESSLFSTEATFLVWFLLHSFVSSEESCSCLLKKNETSYF